MLTAVIAAGDETGTIATDDVRVVFEVSLSSIAEKSSSKPNDLFVAGNLKVLGQWRPDGLRLEQSKDGWYRGEFLVAPGTEVAFKITGGSWTEVEKDSEGRDIRNRQFKISSMADGKPQPIVVTVEQWASPQQVRSSVTGKLVMHEKFNSKHLPSSRHVSVWLPPGYDSSSERYPVLFLHDGQNLFDEATAAFGVEWQADETTTELIDNKEISPVILVGIWNTPERIDEYTFTKDSQLQRGGQGLGYIQFVADELKPFIDGTYRTRSDRDSTWIGGSSLGGLISMHACLVRPDVFGGCLAFSPSLGWDEERLLKTLQTGSKWPSDVRLCFSMGTKEGQNSDSHSVNLSRARRLVEVLRPSDSASIQFQEYPDGTHDERAWFTQFPTAMKFLLGSATAK